MGFSKFHIQVDDQREHLMSMVPRVRGIEQAKFETKKMKEAPKKARIEQRKAAALKGFDE